MKEYLVEGNVINIVSELKKRGYMDSLKGGEDYLQEAKHIEEAFEQGLVLISSLPDEEKGLGQIIPFPTPKK